MKTQILMMTALIALLASGSSSAADAKAAQDKARTLCAGCHGPTGISTNPLWPNLAGQKDQYLEKTLLEYKSGQRADPNMAALAQTLSDEEIANLAAYYAALPAGG